MNEQLPRIAKLAALALPLCLGISSAAASPAAEAGLAASAPSSSATPWLGAGADVGRPDRAPGSGGYRPIRQLRVQAGLAHNMISLGQRIGVTYQPLAWWASPTLSLEYGRFAEGNANPLYKQFAGADAENRPALERVGYDFANARVGLELGRKWFTFYLHAGVSRIHGNIHNLDAETMSESSGTTSVSFPSDPAVTVWSVSARLGFIVYLAK